MNIIDIIKDYKDAGEEVEVYLHNSNSADINEVNFKYRAVNVSNKPASGKGVGIFTHTGTEYFSKFGKNVYAVVVEKNSAIAQMEEDDMSNIEYFVPANKVIEIFKI